MFDLILVGGPTAVFRFGGLRWLTDPTFSPPGDYAGGLTKSTGPALEPAELGPVDVVLLSHEHHSDNLDPAGREYLTDAERVVTTLSGAEQLGENATGVEPWTTIEIDGVAVTAVPALHGPPGSESITGPVIGFVLSDGEKKLYVSGDNAAVTVVEEVAERAGPIDIAILFAGAVQLPHRFGGAYLTLSSDRAAQAAEILGAQTVIPLHFEGWTHFTQGAEQLRASFAGYGLSERLHLPEPGVPLKAR